MMDAWGTIEACPQDIASVRVVLDQAGPVVFPMSDGRGNGMIVLIVPRFVQLGTMPFGGSPNGRLYVALWGKGANHFAPQKTEAGYFHEKLGISKSEAEALAHFWGMLWEAK